jgi:4-hydroxybenzoate polyprenyltransferase
LTPGPSAKLAAASPRIGLSAYLPCIRYRDVLLLQGSPLLGAAFAVEHLTIAAFGRLLMLALGSFLLVAHVFSFNDWAGIAADSNDPNKSALVFSTRGVSSRGVLTLSAILLAGALSIFALLPARTLLIALAIAALGIYYSHPATDAKGTPILSSCPHLIGGLLHFLLGYSLFHPLDHRGTLIGIFFALTFTAGHLNQEVRDYEGDRLNDLRTNAVVFGRRPVFLAGLVVFTLAYADLAILAGTGLVSRALGVLAVVLYPVHLILTRRTLRGGLTFESVSRFQRQYRLLYLLIGLALLLALGAHIARGLSPTP